ncbi:MAG TPA: hypothetical protein VHN79_00120, partial [Lacunisphaera sp.]|nr:hypothetical protein [Lacunisphaera sp.]
MAAPTYSVTLHHLTSDAREAGLNYPDVQLSGITVEQLTGLLRSIEELAATLSIYEPSSPEIRVKTDREVFVIRTRYRHLCFVGNETALRGEEHGVAYIVGAISGNTETLAQPAITPRVFDRPPTAIPVRMHPRGGGGGFSDWAKIALLVVVSLSLVGGGVWMLFRPARSMAPKFTYLPSSEAVA